VVVSPGFDFFSQY